MEIISNIALISINETLVVQLISFLIFLFIINRIMFRPLRETMSERDDYIRKIQRDTIQAHKRVDEIVATTRQEEQDIKQAALKVVAQMESLGKQEANSILNAAREDIASQKRQSQNEIEQELAEAMTKVQAEVQTVSLAIMEKVLNRKVTP
jgi:F-type H+-transporting ATPase subunit b